MFELPTLTERAKNWQNYVQLYVGMPEKINHFVLLALTFFICQMDAICFYPTWDALSELVNVKLYVRKFSSILCVCSLMCDSLWPHGLQHARPPCSSLSPRVCSNSCPLRRWCWVVIWVIDLGYSVQTIPSNFPLGEFPLRSLMTFPATGNQSVISI